MRRPAAASVGERFGRLVVISLIARRGGNAVVAAQCDCGKEWRGVLDRLRAGVTRSCGCLKTETASKRFRKPPGAAAWASALRSYKKTARKRGHSWTLTDDQAKRLMTSACWYANPHETCSVNSAQASQRLDTVTLNGIDRVNNDVGYVPDNVVPCCKKHNRDKSSLTKEQIYRFSYRMQKHEKLVAEGRFDIYALPLDPALGQVSLAPPAEPGETSSTADKPFKYE